MAKKRLLWQLYLPYLIITILALVLSSWYASYSFRWFYYDEIAQNLESRSWLAGRQILPAVNQKNFDEVDQLCKLLGQTAGIRLTMILPDGRVVGDSDQQPAKMENHADRPEFRRAMNGQTGRSVRFSDCIGNKHEKSSLENYFRYGSFNKKTLTPKKKVTNAINGLVFLRHEGLCHQGSVCLSLFLKPLHGHFPYHPADGHNQNRGD